jgi:hypothetical protein
MEQHKLLFLNNFAAFNSPFQIKYFPYARQIPASSFCYLYANLCSVHCRLFTQYQLLHFVAFLCIGSIIYIYIYISKSLQVTCSDIAYNSKTFGFETEKKSSKKCFNADFQ